MTAWDCGEINTSTFGMETQSRKDVEGGEKDRKIMAVNGSKCQVVTLQ